MYKLFLGLAVALCSLGMTSTARADNYYRNPGYDRGHYHYHPGQFERHRDHYHYVPGHYDYHRGSYYQHLNTPRYGGYDNYYRGNYPYGRGSYDAYRPWCR